MTSRNVKLLWNNELVSAENKLKADLYNLGILVRDNHLFYGPDFKPLSLNFDLVIIRHGETFGNCGQSTRDGKIDHIAVQNNIKDSNKRIYQGDVDSEINQLTATGKAQAIAVARQLKENFLANDWQPDIILISPLTRAKDTAAPFIEENQFQLISFELDGIKEMSFGAWENKRVCDFAEDDTCHLFYREQHALIKSTHRDKQKLPIEGENFCEVLLRAHQILVDLQNNFENKRILMFTHSMFAAALRILMGDGMKIENGNYLAFDGKKSDGTPYTIPHAEPIVLNTASSQQRITFKL